MAGMLVLEQGPWGGNGGKTWNMGQADHISNVKIHYNDAVFAFDFTFTVDGVTKTIHVGGDAPQYNEITLEEDEYFTFISRYFKMMWATDVFITQLTLETNKGNSVSAGNAIGSHFSLNLEDEAPSPATASSAAKGVRVHSLFSVAANMGRMVKVGPWGGNGGHAWDMGQADRITKLKIYYGDNIVGLETTYILNGNSHTNKPGTTTGASKEIILEEDEYFTSISGYFHALSNYQRHAIVMLLTLDTNKGASISAGMLVLEQGPWGGNGGKTWNMGQADHISNVKIHYNDAVFAFDFTFTVDGVTKTIHVGGDAPQYNEITLEEDEYFTFISGYFKTMWATDVFITQLTLETNRAMQQFCSDCTKSCNSIFCHQGSVRVHSLFSVAANMGRMVKVGPWGGNGGHAWDMGQADRITKLKIYYGDNIVGLETTYILNGNSHQQTWNHRRFQGGISIHLLCGHTYQLRIILEEDEYFTSISGYFHALSNYQRHAIVMLLTLDTNKGASISVGKKTGTSFALTLEEGSKILGFFGRAGTAIDAVGIHCSLPN
ncbi:Mannose glucose-specific lectin [Musa troglodytarum]|uniref:Mannose glucose-specific lectin n=2 Tax=Musa troglodytarum TaxID=320322 RepID=A0A9E7HYM7_9LILI|nr:Mannose glucose-specific lectin [Musa troglodytarum]